MKRQVHTDAYLDPVTARRLALLVGIRGLARIQGEKRRLKAAVA